MIVILDNYDSFTFNLVQAIGTMSPSIPMRVFRNDEVSVDNLVALNPSHVIISPGPGKPDSAGISVELVRRLGDSTPLLGVCLGHQCIAQAFGARIIHAQRLMHGMTSMIHHSGAGIFHGLPSPFVAARYHSLIVDPSSLPDDLTAPAVSEHGEIMGLQHKELPIHGVQFHPESFLTPCGAALLANFLNLPAREGALPMPLART